ncbi:MAG: hypothetical protein M1817_006935 [Caeruleum heppii]|nr:MAG: hypothetical protein M1817_006935 [Caeruleum heppii]
MGSWAYVDPSMDSMYVNPAHHHQAYEAPPVILPATRPGRYRQRLVTDDYVAPMRYDYHGSLLVPEAGAMRRSRSTGHRMSMPPMAPPAPVVINNVVNDEHADGPGYMFEAERQPRPLSRHQHYSPPSRGQSPYYMAHQDFENDKLRKEVELLRLDKEKEKEAARLKKEMELEIALKEKKKREEEAQRKEIEKQAVVNFQRLQLEKAAKKKKQEEEREADYKERVKRDLGISEHQLSKIVKNSSENALDLRRNTYTKISRRHVSIESLRVYGLPWKYDDHDPDSFVLVKRWVPEAEQELLWDHTRRLREDRSYRNRRLGLQQAKEEQVAKLKVVRTTTRSKSPGLFGILRK